MIKLFGSSLPTVSTAVATFKKTFKQIVDANLKIVNATQLEIDALSKTRDNAQGQVDRAEVIMNRLDTLFDVSDEDLQKFKKDVDEAEQGLADVVNTDELADVLKDEDLQDTDDIRPA